jgi:predicted nuclease of predicted toxin-antitoxin system
VKLLLDENLSPKLASILVTDFPETTQVDLRGLRGSSDHIIWDFALEHEYIIVSKDNDFRQRSFLYGAPPKVIWLSVGNAGTDAIASLLLENFQRILTFGKQKEFGLLVIQTTPNKALEPTA